jgi:GT2 family glycosyltransferase
MITFQRRVSRVRAILKTAGVRTLIIKIAQWFAQCIRKKIDFPKNKIKLSGMEYNDWISTVEARPTVFDSQNLLSGDLPLISVLMPVYETPLADLQSAIQSVLQQSYPHWELWIANASTDQVALSNFLCQMADSDPRLRVVNLPENLGISANTNQILNLAAGTFIALLDHDDILSANALEEVARRLIDQPDLDLIYSDHDLLCPNDFQRCKPLFKPDWSPEALLSANYVTHLTVIRTALVRELGGFDPACDGAQDWDLFLRVSEKTQRIGHISKILYHWRDGSGSTASNIWQKPLAPLAQLRVLEAHLCRVGLSQPKAFFDETGFIRVGWQYPSQPVSIIIPTRGLPQFFRDGLRSLLQKTDYQSYEVILINTGQFSTRDRDFLKQLSLRYPLHSVKVIDDPRPFNYSAANNLGAQAGSGNILVFLNNDIEILSSDWLAELVMWVTRSEIGVVGARLLYPEGTIQHTGVILGLTGFAGHLFAHQHPGEWSIFGSTEWYRNYLAVTGACLAVRREVFMQVNGFDENLCLCGNDIDLCLRVRQLGYRIMVNPFSRLNHLESASRSNTQIPENDYRGSYLSYRPFLQNGDPFYNSNLSYWHTDPALRGPDEIGPLDFVEQFLQTLPFEKSKIV